MKQNVKHRPFFLNLGFLKYFRSSKYQSFEM